MKRLLCAATAATMAALAVPSAVPAAPARYDADTVIVRYADGASSAQRTLAGRLAGVLTTLGRVAGTGARVVRVSGDPAAAAARLNRSPAVLYAEPNYIYRAAATPNDPRFAEQYGLHNTGQNGGTPDADIDFPEAWGSFPQPLNGVKIGIVDTGILATHEDLAGKVHDCGRVRSFGIILGLLADPTIVSGSCADDNGHGTHVAGTAAAYANNGRGVAGVSLHSPLSICKALDASGAGPVAGIANCIVWLAQRGARVISMSLTGTASTTLQNAVTTASQSALLVAAAGNTGTSAVNYPAGYQQVVSVAATDNRDAKAPFSSFNSDVEIAAPGVNILSTWSNGGYNVISGTSMATPHVAGVAAVIAGRIAGGPAAWRDKLDRSVDDLGTSGRDASFGFGRVNLAKAATGA